MAPNAIDLMGKLQQQLEESPDLVKPISSDKPFTINRLSDFRIGRIRLWILDAEFQVIGEIAVSSDNNHRKNGAMNFRFFANGNSENYFVFVQSEENATETISHLITRFGNFISGKTNQPLNNSQEP